MSVAISSHNPGRAITTYDLLDEIEEQHGLSTRAAHEAIHAMLDDIISIDGEDAVILDRQPIRPELLTSNPHSLDIDHWLTISDETAQTVREALAASYAMQG